MTVTDNHRAIIDSMIRAWDPKGTLEHNEEALWIMLSPGMLDQGVSVGIRCGKTSISWESIGDAVECPESSPRLELKLATDLMEIVAEGVRAKIVSYENDADRLVNESRSKGSTSHALWTQDLSDHLAFMSTSWTAIGYHNAVFTSIANGNRWTVHLHPDALNVALLRDMQDTPTTLGRRP